MKARVYLDPYSDFTFIICLDHNSGYGFVASSNTTIPFHVYEMSRNRLEDIMLIYIGQSIQVAEIDLTEGTTCKECGEGTQPGAGSARCPDCWNDRFGDYEEPGYD